MRKYQLIDNEKNIFGMKQATDRAAINHVLIHDDPLSNSRICKHHKAKSSGPARGSISHDHCLHYFSIPAKVFLQPFFICVPRNPTNEELTKIWFHLFYSNPFRFISSMNKFNLNSIRNHKTKYPIGFKATSELNQIDNINPIYASLMHNRIDFIQWHAIMVKSSTFK